MKKIYEIMLAIIVSASVLMLSANVGVAPSRDWVGIIDADGNRADVNADGTLSINAIFGGTVTTRQLTAASDTVTVTAVDFDVRNLTALTDVVTAVATDLDIRNLTAALDTVTVTDGSGSLTVDGTVAVSSVAGSVTVQATDLDVRNLTAASDTVTVSGSISGSVQVWDGATSADVASGTFAGLGTVLTNQAGTYIADIRHAGAAGQDDALMTTLTDGDVLEIDTNGNLNATGTLWVKTNTGEAISIQGGNTTDVSIDDGGNSITVDGTVTATGTLTTRLTGPAGTEQPVFDSTYDAVNVRLVNWSGSDVGPVYDTYIVTRPQMWTANSLQSYYMAHSVLVANSYDGAGEPASASLTLTNNWTYATASFAPSVPTAAWQVTGFSVVLLSDPGAAASDSVPVGFYIEGANNDMIYEWTCDIMETCDIQFSTPLYWWSTTGVSAYTFGGRMSTRAGGNLDVKITLNGWRP